MLLSHCLTYVLYVLDGMLLSHHCFVFPEWYAIFSPTHLSFVCRSHLSFVCLSHLSFVCGSNLIFVCQSLLSFVCRFHLSFVCPERYAIVSLPHLSFVCRSMFYWAPPHRTRGRWWRIWWWRREGGGRCWPGARWPWQWPTSPPADLKHNENGMGHAVAGRPMQSRLRWNELHGKWGGWRGGGGATSPPFPPQAHYPSCAAGIHNKLCKDDFAFVS